MNAPGSAVGAGHAAGGRVCRDPPDQARLRQLADEQAALRRVATLVARGAAPEEVFATVTSEVGRLFGVDIAGMFRYESDGTLAFVASWGGVPGTLPVAGSRWPLEGHNVATLVCKTGRPARIDRYADATGPLGTMVREAGIRSAVAVPITVEGRLWGTMGIDLAIGERTEGPIFLTAGGRRLDRHGAGRIVRRIARRAGITKSVGPHTLRHAFITAALDAGVPLRDVQEAASHADPRTTMRYDRARTSLDRHATYIVAAYVAGAAR